MQTLMSGLLKSHMCAAHHTTLMSAFFHKLLLIATYHKLTQMRTTNTYVYSQFILKR